jgi:hypothetical protein
MSAKETEHRFISRLSECLVSLPFDLKVLQEAVADPDLDRGARELAAGTIMHTLLPQEGEPGPLRFADDALLIRAALKAVAEQGGEGVDAFRDRFSEIYGSLDEDVQLFDEHLGDTWRWLVGKVATFPKLVYKGKRAAQYIDDEQGATFLFEAGLEFQTNYNVTEEQVRNKLRRSEQVIELLNRRRAEEAKKIS